MEKIDQTYSVAEAAQLLGCGEWKLRKMVQAKEIPYYRVGNRIRFTDRSINKWITQQERFNSRS